jgi:hypothetical protein
MSNIWKRCKLCCRPPENEKILSVAELNRDVEPFVIQASAVRTMFFKDPFKPLQFVHFSDVHGVPELCHLTGHEHSDMFGYTEKR